MRRWSVSTAAGRVGVCVTLMWTHSPGLTLSSMRFEASIAAPPPITAWRLHQQLPKSKLIIVEEAGHSESEEGTTRALVEAVAEFE